MSVGEYALDARAAVAALRDRPEVTTIGILGHSMGAAGRSSPRRPTRTSTRSSRSPRPRTRAASPARRSGSPGCRSRASLAWPLAWLTTRVYLRPRGHTIASVSASHAVRAIRVPVLLVHGTDDGVVPVADLGRLAAIRRAARPDAVTETLIVDGGRHSWLYEFPAYRAVIARFLTTFLGGPLAPDEAAASPRPSPPSGCPTPSAW